MRIVLMTCKGREHLAQNIINQIPNVILNYDDYEDSGKFTTTAYFNYVRAIYYLQGTGGIIMEDDVVLCKDFVKRAKNALKEHPDEIIQFFSMRKKDLEVGTRVEPGRNYLMAQCTYFPAEVLKEIIEYEPTFYKNTTEPHSPNDVLVQEALHHYKRNYVIYVPNLVDHMEETSMIDSRRSRKRQSLTFKYN